MSYAPETHIAELRPGLSITYEQAGQGQPVLILHGGGGTATVAGIARHVSVNALSILPTHPGWNGTARPDDIQTVADVAKAYLALLDKLDLRKVVIIGSSIGGWIASEMALQDTADGGEPRIARLVLVNAVGIHVDGEPVADPFVLGPRGLAEHAFHEPDKFFIDPSSLPAEQQAMQRANMATMRIIAGAPFMHDPHLRARLQQISFPVLVVWGESDRVVTTAYGQAFAAAFAHSRFAPVPLAGHLPHLEQPVKTFEIIDEFITAGDA
ncbi:alpha/beta fold hydrolase [Undibacterium sp. Tian12W]|uniref:alpha/beta fold hydrolase n=1 Tax=Undibacterium sp. Tian12W TaxID=3413054 RepID=UPI003BF083D1